MDGARICATAADLGLAGHTANDGMVAVAEIDPQRFWMRVGPGLR